MTDTAELIERLNRSLEFTNSLSAIGAMKDAASRLISLQEEVDRLREVLKPFAEAADGYDLDCQMGDEIQGLQAANEITVGDLVRARSALSRGGGKK